MSISISAIVAGVVFFALPLFLSCRQAGEKQQEKMLEKVVEQGSGEKADVNIEDQNVTIETESGNVQINTSEGSWPAEAPSDVPELNAGKIIGTTISDLDEGKNWSIRYSGVGIEELDKYGATLKSKGFKIHTMKTPKGGMVNGEKGNIQVMFTVSDKISIVGISVAKE